MKVKDKISFFSKGDGTTTTAIKPITNFQPTKDIWATILEDYAAQGPEYRIPNFGISKTAAFAKQQQSQ